jgi:hypothetical protein
MGLLIVRLMLLSSRPRLTQAYRLALDQPSAWTGIPHSVNSMSRLVA